MNRNFYTIAVSFSLVGSLAAQNVGIGTNTPSSKLHVTDATTPNAATIRLAAG
jgi:hypothetical protein